MGVAAAASCCCGYRDVLKGLQLQPQHLILALPNMLVVVLMVSSSVGKDGSSKYGSQVLIGVLYLLLLPTLLASNACIHIFFLEFTTDCCLVGSKLHNKMMKQLLFRFALEQNLYSGI